MISRVAIVYPVPSGDAGRTTNINASPIAILIHHADLHSVSGTVFALVAATRNRPSLENIQLSSSCPHFSGNSKITFQGPTY